MKQHRGDLVGEEEVGDLLVWMPWAPCLQPWEEVVEEVEATMALKIPGAWVQTTKQIA